MSYNDPERELAKAKGFDFVIEDHGCPYMEGAFYYEGGSAQGFGYVVNTAFLMRFMAALGVTRLQDVNGKSCWVTHTNDRILLVEPLHKGEGEPFDTSAWIEWSKSYPSPSPYEMSSGKNPPAVGLQRKR